MKSIHGCHGNEQVFHAIMSPASPDLFIDSGVCGCVKSMGAGRVAELIMRPPPRSLVACEPCSQGVDLVIRPLRPGNSGGGKDTDFWCAFEVGEEGAIGDEPRNTR